MADNRTPEQRTATMRAVKGRGTAPELALRKKLRAMGYRFRLNDKRLPGSPDIAFPSRKKAIFVHGCFWHGHRCSIGRLPKSRLDYWGPKIEANRARDRRKVSSLRKLGWKARTIWQCQLDGEPSLERRLKLFLGPPDKIRSIH